MVNTSVVVEDHQVVKLILEFLDSRRLHNTMRILEKEAGIVNCGFSDDILFLRDLVLDGEWEAILIFAQPFEGIDGFDSKQFRYLVLKQKFMEVLYFKSGFGGNSTSYSIEDLIKCLNQLEEDCPNKTEYSKLCWLLTVPNLPEQPEYRDWSPATARLNCFEQLLDLLKKVIPIDKKGLNGKLPKTLTPIKDRLLHLLIKGLCFESCVDYCQLRAINGALSEDFHVCIGDNILRGPSQESSGNFLSWLRNLSQEAFITPFEPVNLEVDLKKVKHSKGALFHKSPRRDDAEILSRSLSLSGRPATADIASHLAALETGKNTAVILDNRPNSTQPPKGVSHSYNEFHYKGIPEKEPLTDAVSNGFSEHATARETGNEERMSTHIPVPESISHNIDQEHHHSTANHHAIEPTRHLKEIHSLKEQQQQNVLKQLEAHEKQKRELERQLMELSSREADYGKPNGRDLDSVGVSNERPISGESVKNLKNKHLNDDGDFHGTTVQNSHQESREFSFPNQHGLENVNSVQDTPSSTYHPKYEKLDSGSFSVKELITSTPARKAKSKPDDLNLEEAKDDNTASEVIPATPAEQTFPYTPLTNGPAVLSAGHWVALADGSGVLNTSTPKSTRQGLSSTPAPSASPVQSVDGATPRLVYESDTPKVITNYSAPELEQVELIKDKENTRSLNQQVPVKKGPKVNGVRRALVPQAGAKEKVATVDENREMRIPTQGVGNNAQVRVGSTGYASSGTPRTHTPNQQVGQVQQGSGQEGTKVNGQPLRSGTTFVVGPNVGIQAPNNKAANDENYSGGIKASHDNINSGIPKGREKGTINMTYRKPSTNTPPNNTTVTVNHANHILLLEEHKELSSDMKFYMVATLEDVQAIRAIAFHPSGDLFAIGSNSKALRVCTSEGLNSLKRLERKGSDQPPQPTILFKSNRHHRGSIYCVAWSAAGDIIATGSNDKSIKMTRFDAETCSIIWPGLDLAIHSGTVRDLAFVSRASGTPVLVSGGAGDGNIMISDCSTGQTVGHLKGHSGHIMAVYADSDDIIASGSADNTVRLWDLRSQRCIDAIATGDSCVASVCVNTSGNMLASGHEDGSCMIYDITAGRTLQLFTPHTMDCRSVRFSPDNNFLLTGSYDSSIIMMDVRKDLETRIPPYSVVANHRDKVIQCRWHPSLPVFLSSSADKTVSLWAPDH